MQKRKLQLIFYRQEITLSNISQKKKSALFLQIRVIFKQVNVYKLIKLPQLGS